MKTKMAGYMAAVRFLLSVWIFIQTLDPGCDSDVRCRNDSGAPVDWYILYKLPSKFGGGLKYLYMDEHSTNGWRLSTKKINESGALRNTLEPLLDCYDKPTVDLGYILYNDQPPKPCPASSSHGHSKGVVMLDRQTGVWLSHSTPRFPTYRNRNFWPDNGNVNAQIFLCVTFPYNRFKTIGEQLQYINVDPFDSHIPTDFPKELDDLATKDCSLTEEPCYKIAELASIAGHTFFSFAKHTDFEEDLYTGIISEFLTKKKNLYVRSFGNPGRTELLPSVCTTPHHHVYNVKRVKLSHRVSFSDTVDHSKWCVTEGGTFTCIADLNRMESQKKRGGGALCTTNHVVGRAFIALIEEPCVEPEGDAEHTEQ